VKELIKTFLKLGALGFGGPIAMIGYMDTECVRKRKWLTEDEYSKIVAVAKLFPGPLATLISIRIGKKLHGTKGGIVAGICMIFPAFLMLLTLAVTAKSLDRISFLNHFWMGLALAALAVAVEATMHLTKPLFKPGHSPLSHRTLYSVIAITSVLTFIFPKAEAVFIIGAGLFGLLQENILKNRGVREVASFALLMVLFFSCFKASIFTFGSGIAVVPALKTIFIDQLHLISNQDFLRGLTLGQITPGPLLIVATYLGYASAGFLGSVATTVGTFFPAFIFGTYVMPKAESWILGSEKLQAFFAWLLPAVCGAIFGSLLRLMLFSVVVNQQVMWARVGLTALLLFLVLKYKLSPLKIFLLGGVLAYLTP
jgi:chromate transporter